MAIIDISVVPVGTSTPSVSPFVAGAVRILQNEPGIKYELTAMNTIIEGDLEQLLALRGAGREKCMLLLGFTGREAVVKAARREAMGITGQQRGAAEVLAQQVGRATVLLLEDALQQRDVRLGLLHALLVEIVEVGLAGARVLSGLALALLSALLPALLRHDDAPLRVGG